MGDRRNVVIKEGTASVGLYTHWTGTDLPETVKKALARRQRWGDAAYLARIIFCEMVKGEESNETGFGISPGSNLCEASDRDIVIDVDAQTITLGKGKKAMPFNEFIK